MHVQAAQIKVLLLPSNVTSGGVDGAYVDLKGLINPGGRNLKVVLLAGPGETAGTCGGSIVTADDTAGAGATTAGTFAGLNTAGGSEALHFVTNQRYVKFVGTVQTGKDMNLSVVLQGIARDTAI